MDLNDVPPIGVNYGVPTRRLSRRRQPCKYCGMYLGEVTLIRASEAGD